MSETCTRISQFPISSPVWTTTDNLNYTTSSSNYSNYNNNNSKTIRDCN